MTEDDTVVEVLGSALQRNISFDVLRPGGGLRIESLHRSCGVSNQYSTRRMLRMLAVVGSTRAAGGRHSNGHDENDGKGNDMPKLNRLQTSRHMGAAAAAGLDAPAIATNRNTALGAPRHMRAVHFVGQQLEVRKC